MMRYLQIPFVKQPFSVLALGTATRIFTPDTYARAADMLDAFLGAGGNVIDTAHIYNLGASEKTLGRWFKTSGKREQVVLIGKGCHPVIDSGDIFGKPWVPRVTPEAIRADLSESLERLQTEYIDLYLLHRDDERAPVGPILDALNAEQARGRIRAFGASNWHTTRIAEANAYAARHGRNGFVLSSSQFGLVQPAHPLYPMTTAVSETERAWHAANQFPLLAYSPLGAGYISRAAQGKDTHDNAEAGAYASAENKRRVERAVELAKRRGVSAAQIALAYALQPDLTVGAVVGPTHVAHWKELAAALAIALDAGDRAFLLDS